MWRKRCLQTLDVDLGAAVEHFFNFGRFCSTFGGARGGCGVGGRQNSVEKPIFCLLWRLRSADLGAGVDKIR